VSPSPSPALERPDRAASGAPRWAPPPRSVVWAAALAFATLGIYLSRELVLLLILSGIVAYLINPLVKRAEARAIRREVAVTILYLGLIASLGGAAYLLGPRIRSEVKAMAESSPSFAERLDDAVDTIVREIIAEYPAARRLLPGRETRYARLNAFIERQTASLPYLVTHLAPFVVATIFVPFFSYFLLRDSRKIIQFLMDRVPVPHIETSVAIWCEIDRIIGRYLRGVAMDGLVMGAAAGAGLWALGVNYPLLLGALTGIANVVPYLGPILGGGAAMLMALVQFKSAGAMAKVLVLYVSIKLLDDVLVQPITIGKSVHLHPMLLLASVIAGGHALGLIGMIFAVPAVTVLQEVSRILLERRRYHGAPAMDRHHRVPTQPYVC